MFSLFLVTIHESQIQMSIMLVVEESAQVLGQPGATTKIVVHGRLLEALQATEIIHLILESL